MHFLPVIVTALIGKSVLALVWFWQGTFLLLKHLILGLGLYFKRAMWVPLGFPTVTLSDCLVDMPGFAKVGLLYVLVFKSLGMRRKVHKELQKTL